MTLEEQKLAVCEKLPELVWKGENTRVLYWKAQRANFTQAINWPTEGLQVCHEAEKLLRENQFHFVNYQRILWDVVQCEKVPYTGSLGYIGFEYITATYEQRLEALSRVWWPERFV